MTRPLLLDLFAGAGGAAMGYHRAGFDVVGVDIEPQPNYPFEFYQADALTFLETMDALTWDAKAIHASPPCQHYNALAHGTNNNRHDYPALIEPTRELLRKTGLPYVIECPSKWPLVDPIRLCGESFDLGVIRHRYFESNTELEEPPHRKHRGRVAGMRHGVWYEGPYVAVYGNGGGKGSLAQWQQAMGIDWIDTKKSMAEAIPPSYTEWIGRQLFTHVMSGLPC
jgi:DNA (cytosine-5)-methyltransferase 1